MPKRSSTSERKAKGFIIATWFKCRLLVIALVQGRGFPDSGLAYKLHEEQG
jgi:hypothetical protein